MRLSCAVAACLFVFCLDLSSSEKHRIKFFRPAVPGSLLDCRISAVNTYSATSEFTDRAIPEKVVSSTNKATAEGLLKILDVNANGHATRVEFKISSIHGEIGSSILEPKWEGKTLQVEMDCMPCRYSFKDSEVQFKVEELRLLALLFHPAPEESTADFIGTDQPVAVGDSWAAGTEPFIRLFRKQGMNMPPEKILGSVTLKSRSRIGEVDCWEIEEKLNVEGVPNFSFHFSLSLFLPVDSRHGNLKMVRKAYQKLVQTPDGKHPLTAGIEKTTLEMTDTMTAMMVPKEPAE